MEEVLSTQPPGGVEKKSHNNTVSPRLESLGHTCLGPASSTGVQRHCHFCHSREGPRAVAGREREALKGLYGHLAQASLHRQRPVSVEVGVWPGSHSGLALVTPVLRKNLEEASLSIWGEGGGTEEDRRLAKEALGMDGAAESSPRSASWEN